MGRWEEYRKEKLVSEKYAEVSEEVSVTLEAPAWQGPSEAWPDVLGAGPR